MKVRQLIVVVTIVGAVASLAVAVAAGRTGAKAERSTAAGERLRGMLPAPNELPGYSAIQCPRLLTKAEDWGRHDPSTTAALRTEGFFAGVRESLTSGTRDFAAASEAVEFHSAAGARRDVVRQLVVARMMGLPRQFPVPGIPAASGYALVTAGRMSYHVAFSVGADEVGVALAVRPGGSPSEGEAEVVAAAARIFARTS